MNIYLAGNGLWGYVERLLNPERIQRESRENPVEIGGIPSKDKKVNILESFYYADDLITSLIPYFQNFMLDSGAFTFFTQGRHVDWDEYVTRYIEYIKKNNVKLFFELDIDVLIGYDRVLDIRRRLEREIGRPPIPVWHKSRGKRRVLPDVRGI